VLWWRASLATDLEPWLLAAVPPWMQDVVRPAVQAAVAQRVHRLDRGPRGGLGRHDVDVGRAGCGCPVRPNLSACVVLTLRSAK
jgi:hypothetical protein